MVENDIDKRSEYRFHNVQNQVIAVFTVNIIMLSFGCIIGWTSPALLVLQSENSPLITGPITTEEISWIGSIISLGSLVGSIITSYISKLIGVKRAILLLGIPAVLFWLAVAFGYLVEHLYVARFLAGWTGGGIQTCVPIFIGDIANNDIRGRLGIVNQFTRNIGILLAYTGGAYLDYSVTPFAYISVPIIFIIIFVILPNTPQYLIAAGRTEEAKRALMFYKDCKGETPEEEEALCNELVRLKLIANQSKSSEKFEVKYLFESESIKALVPAIMLTLMNQMCGALTIVTYSNYIFEQTGTNFESNTSSIVLALLLICGNLLTTPLVDSIGRKKLLLSSMFGCCVGLSSMGIYLYLESIGLDVQFFNWVPVVSLGTVVLVSAFGLAVMPGICIIEWLPSKIRTFGLTVCSMTLYIFGFTATKLFPVLAERIHLYGCMFIFAIGSAFGVIYFAIVMKETKGKSLNSVKYDEEMRDDLNGNNY